MSAPEGNAEFSFLRHIGTLSAGAVALQISFLEKIFPHPQWKRLMAISMIAFTASIVGSILTQWALLGIKNNKPSETWRNFGGCSAIVMWVTFVLGLLTAVIFSLKNLFPL